VFQALQALRFLRTRLTLQPRLTLQGRQGLRVLPLLREVLALPAPLPAAPLVAVTLVIYCSLSTLMTQETLKQQLKQLISSYALTSFLLMFVFEWYSSGKKTGCRRKAIPSVNKEGREKNTDARRWSRFIVDRRWGINRLPVSIRPIYTPAAHIVVAAAPVIVTVAVIATAPVIITALAMSYPAVMVISGKGRRHVHTADHCG
jgi:hypothetical protein